MDNTTGDFVSPLIGLPTGMVRIPRERIPMTKRAELNSRDLGCSGNALSKLRKHHMEDIVGEDLCMDLNCWWWTVMKQHRARR